SRGGSGFASRRAFRVRKATKMNRTQNRYARKEYLMDNSAMKVRKSVPLSAFSTSSSFAIDPRRVGLLESAYPGCIEVILSKCDRRRERTPAGGSGLTFSGNIPVITGRFDVLNRLALVAGFDEVFEEVCQYDDVVVLRPLGVGLGVNWERYRQYAGRTHR